MKRYMVLFSIFLFIFMVLLGVVLLKDDPVKLKPDKRSKMDAGNVRIVMLGDSLTFRGDWKLLLNRRNVVNRGIDGDTTRDMLMRLDGVIGLQPEICCIMAGINDISRGRSVEGIFENYRTIMEKMIENGIRPVVQSTLYVTASFFEPEDINKLVRRLNHKLKEYADKNAILFIDLNRTMSDQRGLIPEYTVDGVHLSQKGYRAWSGILFPVLKKLKSEQ